jgi:hypothetical protein
MINKTEILKGVFTEDFLSEIQSLIEQHMKTLSADQVVRAYHGDYYSVGQEATDLITAKLPLLPGEVCAVNLLRHTKVTGPHTDTNIPDDDTCSDPNRFARTMIVPLKTQDTYTITFNQHMALGTRGNDMVEFVQDLPAINKISNEELETYFSSSKDQYWIEKLSVETAFPWIAGDALVFDRRRIHTGDDHLDKLEKEGIVIWTDIH